MSEVSEEHARITAQLRAANDGLTALVRAMMDNYGLHEVEEILSQARVIRPRLAKDLFGLDLIADTLADRLVEP